LHLATSAFREPGDAPTKEDARLSVSVEGQRVAMREGDGIYVDLGLGGEAELRVTSTGGKDAEFVLIEMTS
jgi:hypothetical protein